MEGKKIGRFIYSQTFNLTTFEATEELTAVLPIKGALAKEKNVKEIIIKLKKVE